MNFTRHLSRYIKADLVFVGGPRKVGKTTLAKSFLKSERQYLNWNDLRDREIIKRHEINPDLKVVVLDEIHKYARWRTLVKGLFDKYHERLAVLVTGSAREGAISPHIRYFRDRTDIPKFYQVHMGSRDYLDGNIRVLPFESFCKIERTP
jgi:predicted AAA+ superfamily ATPase